MKRNNPRRAGAVGGEYIGLAAALYDPKHTTPPPAFHPALCRECGISWNRPESRPWADLCPTCWRWNMARRHVRAARKLVEG
jgi:hypothetical protein